MWKHICVRGTGAAADKTDERSFGAVSVDLRGTTASRNGKPSRFQRVNFGCLRYFVLNPGTTLSRETLLKEVWGYNEDTFTRTVDVHVGSLRQKVEEDPKNPRFIVTVPGLGYKFTGP